MTGPDDQPCCTRASSPRPREQAGPASGLCRTGPGRRQSAEQRLESGDVAHGSGRAAAPRSGSPVRRRRPSATTIRATPRPFQHSRRAARGGGSSGGGGPGPQEGGDPSGGAGRIDEQILERHGVLAGGLHGDAGGLQVHNARGGGDGQVGTLQPGLRLAVRRVPSRPNGRRVIRLRPIEETPWPLIPRQRLQKLVSG